MDFFLFCYATSILTWNDGECKQVLTFSDDRVGWFTGVARSEAPEQVARIAVIQFCRV
jgi:hypothetical protein